MSKLIKIVYFVFVQSRVRGRNVKTERKTLEEAKKDIKVLKYFNIKLEER